MPPRILISVGLGDAPVTLALTFTSALVLALQAWGVDVQQQLAAIPWPFMWHYEGVWGVTRRCLAYIVVHRDAAHFLANYSSILLVGPALESAHSGLAGAGYGSAKVALLVMINAVSTAIANALLFDTGLIGSSGVAMMMLLLLAGAQVRSQIENTSSINHSNYSSAAAMAWSTFAEDSGPNGKGSKQKAQQNQQKRLIRIPLPLLLLLCIHVLQEVSAYLSEEKDLHSNKEGRVLISRFAHLFGVAVGFLASLLIRGGNAAIDSIEHRDAKVQ